MYTALYMHNPYSLWGYSYFYRSSLSTVPPSILMPIPLLLYLCSTSIMDTRLYGLETRALAMLRPFYGCLCTFFGLSVSASSSLSHLLVEIQH